MNVYVCTDHKGHWPVGVASVVIAATEDDARALLEMELVAHGLGGGTFTLRKIQNEKPQAFVLMDGDY